LPHLGHLHTKDFRLLKLSSPGQCRGVFISFPPSKQFTQA
jgi:hypothetical protein